MADSKETVFEVMKKAGGPVKAGEVADATGIDKKEVSKIINTLKKEGKVTSPKNCFYQAV
ncbi:MAG: FaeA/PapI family transcriptional regulator [Chloroflexota bacterium]|nr:FaeA/PapI family transcriptional regulator [Chloroflexota bacterium]